jgi:hypothetical protein
MTAAAKEVLLSPGRLGPYPYGEGSLQVSAKISLDAQGNFTSRGTRPFSGDGVTGPNPPREASFRVGSRVIQD